MANVVIAMYRLGRYNDENTMHRLLDGVRFFTTAKQNANFVDSISGRFGK